MRRNSIVKVKADNRCRNCKSKSDNRIFSYIHFDILDPVRLPVAVLALVIVALGGAVAGAAGNNANPFFWSITDFLIGGIGRRLDRSARGERDLIIRGFIVAVCGLAIAFVCGQMASDLVARYPIRGLTEIFFLSLILGSGAAWRAVLRLYRALENKKVAPGAYLTIAKSTRTDFSASDNYTMTRAGLAFAARSFDRGAVAPIFWYLIAGLAGAYMYAGLAALAWLFGRDGFTKGFGKAALVIEAPFGAIPSLISGLFLAFGGLFTPTGSFFRGIRDILALKSKSRAPYAEGGAPVTAMAGVLNVSLGGPVVDLDGRTLKRTWVGPEKATAQLEAGHLRRGLYLTIMAYLLFIVALMATAIGVDRLLALINA